MNTKYVKEFVTFPDVTIMLVLLAPLLGYTFFHLLSYGTWIAFGIGMATYGMSEYVVHRFLFHMKTPENPTLLKVIKRLHFDHHAYPDDLKLLFLPLWFSLPGFAIFSTICYFITNNFTLTIAYLAGIVLYFMIYEWKHYVAHRPIQPRTAFGKKIKKVHLWHHFKNENYWFGVTHTSIDKTFGTYKDQKLVEKSETAKNLEKRA
ncbi:sterol desaturase family protein [Sporosarcina luteola]|uniref:sterol desaturase family protein n=1 Tax=Sporosarcina luteola TaxID=582850 RepID=UPI00203CA979|nr:sterol desaturase family protein [Sporosarcina luteola]MCM3745138.1 sterol desaturase family protein [Sporosarcina luteola]